MDEKLERLLKAFEVLPERFSSGEFYNTQADCYCGLGWALKRNDYDPRYVYSDEKLFENAEHLFGRYADVVWKANDRFISRYGVAPNSVYKVADARLVFEHIRSKLMQDYGNNQH